MKQGKCYTCDKMTHNLLAANCSHRICFNCVKNNRNTHKCSRCSGTASKNKLYTLSPARKEFFDKQRESATKNKSIESNRYHDQHSPFVGRSSRKSQVHVQSCSNYGQSSINQQANAISIDLLCKQHHQPLTLFSKTTKQAICSVCLCNKPKYKEDIMPIKGAQDFLKRQNRSQREQSRIILHQVQQCYKTIKGNFESFGNYYTGHTRVVSQIFSNLHKTLQAKQNQLRIAMDTFFLRKMKECQQIQQDLSYLIQTLKTYRQENKQSNSLTEALYVYSSFKVIKKTMKTLNLDYITYSDRNVNLLQFNQGSIDTAFNNLLKFNQHLPLKNLDALHRSKSRSRPQSQNRKQIGSNSGGYSKKKHSIYQDLLIKKINKKQNIQHSSGKFVLDDSSGNKIKVQHNGFNKMSKSHNNSLSTFGQHNVQKSRHNNSTSQYLNESKMNKKPHLSNSNVFDYQLKTPIKNIVNSIGEVENNAKGIDKSSFQRSSNKRTSGSKSSNKNQYNIISSNGITGLDMTQEQKSLYKRLLKSRFTKNPYQQTSQLVQIIKIQNQKLNPSHQINLPEKPQGNTNFHQ